MNTILICLIVCSVYGFVIYKILSIKINKKVDNKTFLKEVYDEINSLINQINETADRNVLLIENRLERLNSMISQSDRSITNIKNASIKQKVDSENLSKELSKEFSRVKEQEKKPEVTFDPISEPIIEIIEEDKTLTKREKILLLHKQGISSSIIASQTKATIGEVELIISLSRG